MNNGKITEKQAQSLKEKAAKKRALNIQNKLELLDLNISLIQRNQDSTDVADDYINVGRLLTEAQTPLDSMPSTTRFGVSLGFAWSNVANTGTDDIYKTGFSADFGFYFNSVFSRKDPRWRLDYGFSVNTVQVNLKHNLILKDDINTTVTAEFPKDLDRSQFVLSNLVFPVHLEFGPAPIVFGKDESFFTENEKHAYYDTSTKFKAGLGGFFGFKLASTLRYKYDKNGKFDDVAHHRSYNTHNFLYGVSAYVQYDVFRLFVRYNLNDVFKSAGPGVNGKVISIGFAFAY